MQKKDKNIQIQLTNNIEIKDDALQQKQQVESFLQINLDTKYTNRTHKLQCPSNQNNALKPQYHQENGVKQIKRVKSERRMIIIGLIISLSALMFGYSLKEITSVPISTIVKQYDITITSSTASSVLIGVLPIGAIFGAILTKFLIKRYRRLTGIYLFAIINILAIVLVNILNFYTLIIGRFIEGICVGFYSAIAPVYLKEIAPKELRKLLGLFFSFGKIIGVLVAIIIELIFQAVQLEIGWRIILSLTAVFAALQGILIFIFGSDTPAEMIEKGNAAGAKRIISDFYKHQYIDEVLNEYKKEFKMEMAKGKQASSENINDKPTREKIRQKTFKLYSNEDNLKKNNQIYQDQITETEQDLKIPNRMLSQKKDIISFETKKNYAYCLGIHLSIIRHWTGGNAIITQGGLFITTFNRSLGMYTSLIINSIQFIFIIIGMVVIQKKAGKRPLFLISIGVLGFTNIGLAVSMMLNNVIISQFILCFYMAIYGAAFISPIWAYPSEIIPASQSMIPNIVHWLALAFSTLIPPLITGAMPGHNPYPIFLFFGLYSFIGFIHVFRYLRESDGYTYNQIIKSFK